MYNVTYNDPKGGSVLNHPKVSTINNAIRAHGIDCHIKKGILCPCLNKDTGQPRFNCVICHGTGYFYDSYLENPTCKIGSIIHKVAIAPRTKRNTYNNKSGGYNEVDSDTQCYIYTYEPAEGDLIIPLKDIVIVNDEQHIKGAKFNDGYTSAEILKNPNWLNVEGIFVVNSALTAISKYYLNTHFTVSASGTIQWISGASQPSEGSKYTVRYKARPSYIILKSAPQLMLEHDEDVPKNYREKKDVVMPFVCTITRIDRRQLSYKTGIGQDV